CVQAKAFPFTF
nr:immunoglobulin light chain junction region [Macaca mulatta]MOV62343.1 immunoglobulin light chain junction region [Macaca mulatta]MOV63497.1 immunoglobulin light chain junction region [Macaca mulatta]MOV64396.1 immunoglobulin light chain junction region [Macaca mulatta]MOV65623.1 immunoglobulin light chain junction region [Macaca mulatta]